MPYHSRRFLIAFILLAALLGACTMSMADDTPLPTPLPTDYLPTAIALTAEALTSPTAPAAASVPPSPTAPLPTATATPAGPPTATPFPITLPTATPTPPPPLSVPGTGYAVAQILYPGMDSRVLSPFRTRIAVQTRHARALHVELVGEDGRVIYRRVIRLDEDQPAHSLLYFYLEIPFEIAGEAEMGRLQVSTWDEYNRCTSQNAITLTLLRTGQAQISYQIADRAPILFKQPQARQVIQGGTLVVVGKALPASPMVEAMLVDTNGKVLGYQTAPLSTPAEDGYALFTFSMPYKVTDPTQVLLVVQENGVTPPGVMYLESVPLVLSP